MEVKYYKTSSGRHVVLEFIEDLSRGLREEFFETIAMLENGEILKMPLSKPLSNIANGLHELRFKDRTGIYRVFYYLKINQVIYLLHALKKKTEKIPSKEIGIIRRRLKEIR